MTKLQLTLTSLVAVIPATILFAILVMAMISETMSTMAYVVSGGTLLSALVTMLITPGIWVMGRRAPKSVAATVPASNMKDTGKDIDAIDDSAEHRSSSESFDAQDVLNESSEYDLGDSSLDMLSTGEDSEFEVDTESVDDFEDFSMDDDDEPKPKKKKR